MEEEEELEVALQAELTEQLPTHSSRLRWKEGIWGCACILREVDAVRGLLLPCTKPVLSPCCAAGVLASTQLRNCKSHPWSFSGAGKPLTCSSCKTAVFPVRVLLPSLRELDGSSETWLKKSAGFSYKQSGEVGWSISVVLAVIGKPGKRSKCTALGQCVPWGNWQPKQWAKPTFLREGRSWTHCFWVFELEHWGFVVQGVCEGSSIPGVVQLSPSPDHCSVLFLLLKDSSQSTVL